MGGGGNLDIFGKRNRACRDGGAPGAWRLTGDAPGRKCALAMDGAAIASPTISWQNQRLGTLHTKTEKI